MKLHDPFLIGPRLAPALRIGDCWLSYIGPALNSPESGRAAAFMALDFPDGLQFLDSSMQSGVGGFQGMVSIFETYLGFLYAALESKAWEERTGNEGEGENTGLFPPYVLSRVDKSDVEGVLMLLADEEGRGIVNEGLIEDQT